MISALPFLRNFLNISGKKITNELEIYEMGNDKKRGSGVHSQILKAMENTHGVGLAFGIIVIDFLKKHG
jgi:hypothetical protein